ncbi:protein of unknown function [Agrococcus baldri]|uniref:DUF3846 domain-containing protein n=1 Tax=Agrococcus baldri TaxID=153730 RepID=A0AA94HN57_9MICO|nr:DUF3846 domain-containing protein [Agrococcus baldri]SFS14708.1 protein of unknown function [Agrococcus baldri]
MTTAVWIQADTIWSPSIIEVDEMADYQSLVDGWVEALQVPSLGITIFVNEEGRLRRLKFNARASLLWWQRTPEARNQMICGDAVIVGTPDATGKSTDAPDDLVTMLTEDGLFAVLVKIPYEDQGVYVDPVTGTSNHVVPLPPSMEGWYVCQGMYPDYFSAAVWAMLIEERWASVDDTKVASVAGMEHLFPKFMQRRSTD